MPNQPVRRHADRRKSPCTEVITIPGRPTREVKRGEAIHWYLSKQDIWAIRYLLKNGYPVDSRCNTGQTPLHRATLHGNTQLVALLLTAGADPNARDGDGETPLATAVWNGHLEVVRMLIAAGADLEAKDGGGWTPLHEAASIGDVTMIVTLLEAGANPQALTGEEESSLDLAPYPVRRVLQSLLEKRAFEASLADYFKHGDFGEWAGLNI
ncbi:Ankyrin repeat [Methylomagnum ishizawai]|uniref:Ankyrin repeat n=1 Tax=Methylomagnum ishizawai TaxID=1760988 RepID=A0A1Y6CVN4_9GAMM|nr:ankyrin repeat domain-containing protein [Methylomagnum ishizawai]SMF94397.1 Ankyrin repeat [Methylomagnum ishizawai]